MPVQPRCPQRSQDSETRRYRHRNDESSVAKVQTFVFFPNSKNLELIRQLLHLFFGAAVPNVQTRQSTLLASSRWEEAMAYPEHYREELVNAIQGIDLGDVREVIELFQEARAHGKRIFLCGSGNRAIAAAGLLCELVRPAFTRASAFRILVLSDEFSDVSSTRDLPKDRVFIDQLKNVAEQGDVVVAISASANAGDVLRALEYANRIGCRTVSITGRDGGKLAALSSITVLVPASHPGSIEDAHTVICHMIGYYFAGLDKG